MLQMIPRHAMQTGKAMIKVKKHVNKDVKLPVNQQVNKFVNKKVQANVQMSLLLQSRRDTDRLPPRNATHFPKFCIAADKRSSRACTFAYVALSCSSSSSFSCMMLFISCTVTCACESGQSFGSVRNNALSSRCHHESSKLTALALASAARAALPEADAFARTPEGLEPTERQTQTSRSARQNARRGGVLIGKSSPRSSVFLWRMRRTRRKTGGARASRAVASARRGNVAGRGRFMLINRMQIEELFLANQTRVDWSDLRCGFQVTCPWHAT